MLINGYDASFDLDIRKDYEKFGRALLNLQKRQQNEKDFNMDDMENFIKACLSKEDSEYLLKDGRVSTLAKVFVEFFDICMDQVMAVASIYQETAQRVEGMQDKLGNIQKKFGEITDGVSRENSIDNDDIQH